MEGASGHRMLPFMGMPMMEGGSRRGRCRGCIAAGRCVCPSSSRVHTMLWHGCVPLGGWLRRHHRESYAHNGTNVSAGGQCAQLPLARGVRAGLMHTPTNPSHEDTGTSERICGRLCMFVQRTPSVCVRDQRTRQQIRGNCVFFCRGSMQLHAPN